MDSRTDSEKNLDIDYIYIYYIYLDRVRFVLTKMTVKKFDLTVFSSPDLGGKVL